MGYVTVSSGVSGDRPPGLCRTLTAGRDWEERGGEELWRGSKNYVFVAEGDDVKTVWVCLGGEEWGRGGQE